MACVLLALAAACADGQGPVGAPGGRDGIRLRYITPRLQVVPAGAAAKLRVALQVRRETDHATSAPLAGARIRASLEGGPASLPQAAAVTDADGVATLDVRLPGARGRSTIQLSLESDPRSFLPFDVVAAPIQRVELPVGEIEHLAVPRDGVILRFRLDAGEQVFLIPHQTDVDRTSVPYRFLYQPGGSPGTALVLGAESVATPQLATTGEESGDVVRGSLDPGGLAVAASIPGTVSIRSCLVDVDRRAPLRYLGDRIALYVDGPSDLHQSRIDSIGRAFDERIFPTNTRLFGPTSDYDGNGRILVIMTPELDRGGVYCDTIRTIGIEAFYGDWNPTDAIDRALGTLAHEHQHVINASHHIRTTGGIGDDRWLNEAMSYAAEALHGYWGGAMTRMWLFLGGQNNGLSMMSLDYAATFSDEYMMFLIYLRDRFGQDLYLALGESGRTGVGNVESMTGVGFSTLLRDWFVANAVSGRGITDDPRYSYRSLDLHGMSAEIAACRCVPPARFDGMTMEPLPLEQPFDIVRTLDRADADYYSLEPKAAPGGAGEYDLFWDAYGRAAVGIIVVRAR